MPKIYLMNWQQDKSRWRKMLRGKWYFVTPKELGCLATKEASWSAANNWWKQKLASETSLRKGIEMIDVSIERMMRILEIRKHPENATPEDIMSLADDFILLTFNGNPLANIAVNSIIKSEEKYGEESKSRSD